LSDAHTNEIMIKIVVNILKKYKLKNCLFAIIIDNASNNEKMRKEMKKILKKIDIEWNHEKNHVFCIVHVIQFAVNELLESMKIFAVNDKMNQIFQENRLNDIDKEIDWIDIFLKIWYFSWIFLECWYEHISLNSRTLFFEYKHTLLRIQAYLRTFFFKMRSKCARLSRSDNHLLRSNKAITLWLEKNFHFASNFQFFRRDNVSTFFIKRTNLWIFEESHTSS
jgi:hypothetical protein